MYCQVITSSETTLKLSWSLEAPFERPPTLLHPHQAVSAMQKHVVSIRAELRVLQSVFSSTDLPSVVADKSASGCMLSGSWVIVFNAKHVSHSPSSPLTTLYAVPSDYLNIIHKKASPIAYLCCPEKPSDLSAASILQPSSKTSLVSS